jgi:hypothetical protein
MGGNTADVAHHQGEIIADGLERLRAGEAPASLLNPETLARFAWGAPRPAPTLELIARLSRRPAPGVTDLARNRSQQP